MSSLAIAETKKLESDRRRKSLFNRNGVAKKIRELHENIEVQKSHNEHQNYLLKWAGEKYAEAYKKHLSDQRRDSLAFRNEEGRRQREVKEQHKSE